MVFEELKASVAAAWSEVCWERAAARLAGVHDALVAALGPQPGERWLDVATGTGAVALRAARAGADVTAQDIAPGQIERARELAEAEGLEIRFDVGDAEDLAYPDVSFDVVASALGAIFTPDHARMAGELGRVCRPGGRLGLAAWRPGGEHEALAELLSRFRPPSPEGVGDCFDWGRREEAERLLRDAFELRFVDGVAYLTAASMQELWEILMESAGTRSALVASLDAERLAELREAFVEFHERFRGENGFRIPHEYLLVLGTRR